MPLDLRADSNFRANSCITTVVGTPTLCGAVSVETGDNYYAGDPRVGMGWTQLGQRATLEDLLQVVSPDQDSDDAAKSLFARRLNHSTGGQITLSMCGRRSSTRRTRCTRSLRYTGR
jgi:hypothetical protein